ncbi:MAG TPA: minichromosome maintenance protein MCM [Thermoprotei archaeon]|nr:minichromosome maintenance protein MCM [Thermoprotei archaeon]
MAEIETHVLDTQSRFTEFLKSFRDENGEYKYRLRLNEMVLKKKQSLIIDFEDLLSFDRQLASLLIESPKKIIEDASKAIKEVMLIENREYADSIDHFIARFRGIPQIVPLREIRAIYIGKMISVEGIITRISPVKEELKEAYFRCKNCGEEISYEQTGSKITYPPHVCAEGFGKRKRPPEFEIIFEKSKFIDWQKLVLQEKIEELPHGQMPRTIEIIAKEDLVDTVRPGDRVTVTGILSIYQEFAKNVSSPIFKTYIEANYIDVISKENYDVEITPEDEKIILELSKDPQIREKIVRSIAPSIHGYEYIKKAIACLLFGGEPKIFPDNVRVRGDINILLVGDPGTAKSQLLRYVSRIAPRGIYTTGKGSTAAGLTAAVVREKRTGDFYLEAGALVLADGGVACIDEFDKMDPRDRVSIHEAMEQQTISIAKAGIIATLNARTSVLAAANPALGRYIRDRTIADNIDLPVTILSRFDLIFILTDIPDVKRDRDLAEHLVRLHSGRYTEIFKNIIDPTILRKYIAYARRYVHPKLTAEAMKKIVDFYTEMRSKSESPESPVAITPRQLEALIRLAEAHAKIGLSDVVTEEDVDAAIELTMKFLSDVGLDIETKTIDIDIVMTGKPASQREKLMKLLDIIRKYEIETKGEPIKVSELIKRGEEEGLDRKFIESALNLLRRNGEIYEPKPGYIKKT